MNSEDKKKKTKREEILFFIKKQINIDLKNFIDEEESNKNKICIIWKKLNFNQQNQIKLLAKNYNKINYILEDNGGLGMILKFPKNK